MAGLRRSKGGQIEIGSGGTGECIGLVKEPLIGQRSSPGRDDGEACAVAIGRDEVAGFGGNRWRQENGERGRLAGQTAQKVADADRVSSGCGCGHVAENKINVGGACQQVGFIEDTIDIPEAHCRRPTR